MIMCSVWTGVHCDLAYQQSIVGPSEISCRKRLWYYTEGSSKPQNDMQTMKTKFCYSIWREENSNQYHHIHVNVYRRSEIEADLSSTKPVISFSWQGDSENDHWYAFKAESECEYYPRTGVQQFRSAASILDMLSDTPCDNPDKVLAALGFDRVVNDDREGKWLSPEAVKPASWSRYMAWLDGSCCVACIAADEETAAKALAKRFAENLDSGWGNYLDKLEAWINAGKPIKEDGYRHAPDVRSLEDILKPMKEPEAVEPAAEPVAA